MESERKAVTVTVAEDGWYGDRDYETAIERGERAARCGLAVSAGVAALMVGAAALAILLGFVVLVGGALLFVNR
ncbi:hypothetical protein ACWEQL_21125 [Kitasatospora sp. NPDC004240]